VPRCGCPSWVYPKPTVLIGVAGPAWRTVVPRPFLRDRGEQAEVDDADLVVPAAQVEPARVDAADGHDEALHSGVLLLSAVFLRVEDIAGAAIGPSTLQRETTEKI